MDPTTFLLLAGMVLFVIILAGIKGRSAPPGGPAPLDEIHRWTVFRLHLDRILGGGGPVVEALPGKPILTARGRPSPKRLCLMGPSGKPMIVIQAHRRFTRRVVRISLDRRPLAELRSRKGECLEEVRSREIDFDISGDALALELELRRMGKLLASVSPEIAASPRTVGVEVLASADPMPVLAVVAAIAFLRELTLPSEALALSERAEPTPQT